MEGMSEKMDKQPATLPVSVEMKQQPQQQARAACPPFLHIDVPVVNIWMFLNALISCAFNFGFAIAYYILVIGTSYPSQAQAGTHAENTLVSALALGMLWCCVPQATAGALALLLPNHRWRLRRAAAYVALPVTAAGHCMCAGVLVVFIVNANPRPFITIVFSAGIFICAVSDLLGFLAHLRERAH